jgi:hypothetical protein
MLQACAKGRSRWRPQGAAASCLDRAGALPACHWALLGWLNARHPPAAAQVAAQHSSHTATHVALLRALTAPRSSHPPLPPCGQRCTPWGCTAACIHAGQPRLQGPTVLKHTKHTRGAPQGGCHAAPSAAAELLLLQGHPPTRLSSNSPATPLIRCAVLPSLMAPLPAACLGDSWPPGHTAVSRHPPPHLHQAPPMWAACPTTTLDTPTALNHQHPTSPASK